jgi:hypothetical protein
VWVSWARQGANGSVGFGVENAGGAAAARWQEGAQRRCAVASMNEVFFLVIPGGRRQLR